MAEKRGQYQYNDDGTVSALVHTTNSPDANSVVPMDKQAQLKQQIENNTTALGASATYTGASFDTMADGVNFTWLTGVVYSNVAGTLFIDQSVDGTRWLTPQSISIGAGVSNPIDVTILSRYIRLRYVNQATAQTSFDLHAYATFK